MLKAEFGEKEVLKNLVRLSLSAQQIFLNQAG
jgi:hypothetical protein